MAAFENKISNSSYYPQLVLATRTYSVLQKGYEVTVAIAA